MTSAVEVLVIAAVSALTLRRAAFLVAAQAPRRPLTHPSTLPSVTVLVAARNEATVADRLLAALAKLEYPSDRLSFVLVCDGCTDGTSETFARWAAGRSAAVVALPARLGKAAALNAGLGACAGEIVVVLDADLRPRPDFLRELVAAFADERVAAAAAYLHPVNADANVVARYAAVTSWVHQLVTSAAADRLGLNPPTFGAAGYRRSALAAIGGFPVVPVGVDVAASRRLTRQGWRTRFVRGAVADNVVVSEFADYWRQHVRWARSGFRVPAHERPRFRGSTPQRIEAWVAALGYGDRLVFVVAAVGAAVGALQWWVPVLYLAAPGVEIVVAALAAGVRRKLPRVLLAVVVFFPADLVASLAAVAAQLARRPYRWQSPRRVPAGAESNQ